MKLDNARDVEQLCYDMKLADWPRALNRTRINDLFNGVPPYDEEESAELGIEVNFNDLASTRLGHDARSQFYSAFLKPGTYFNAKTDMGAAHRRQERSAVVTTEMNKIMKRSLPYFECFRSKFASNVLHGIGPSGWDSDDYWCPDPYGIEDVMIPGRTLLTMKNLPFVAVYRSYTAPELIRITRGPKVDPGWNMDLVKECIKWVDAAAMELNKSNWPESWSPEKMAERIKGDGGCYASDQVPTVDCWDVYAWDDDGKTSGWERRLILDSWSTPQASGKGYTMNRNSDMDFAKDKFLYTSGRRKFASARSEFVTFQFADLSAVSPFNYHSVRSLGFLIYAVCTVQNRLRCSFTESVFESLLQYFRCKTVEDAQRALKVVMRNRGFIDETLQFIPANERYQVNAALVELGLRENANLVNQNAASFRVSPELSQQGERKTKFQVMSEMQGMTQLVSAGLLQAYAYQLEEFREIFRRFMKPPVLTRDTDVHRFRANVLKRGVPEKMLIPEAWDLESEKVMGAGNKSLEMAIAEQLMQFRPLFDPDPQRKILRDMVLAITDDPGRAAEYVPETQNKVTDSVHDAQLAAGTLMQGLPVALKTGYNHAEYAETLLRDMGMIVSRCDQSGGMATQEQILGLQMMAQHIGQHLQILAQDKESKQQVKQLGDILGKLMNQVKAFAQRLQEAQQKAAEEQAQSNGGLDPKDAAKIQATMLTAKAKADNAAQSHAQRTAQRALQFEQKFKQDQRRAQQELATNAARANIEITRARLTSLNGTKKKKSE